MKTKATGAVQEMAKADPTMTPHYAPEDDMNTMMRAEEIKAHPERMANVQKLAGRHKKAITSIQDLKNVYDKKFGAGAPKPDPEKDGM
jgi:hypothetical protein